MWEDIASMLKIDRTAFLALALGMNLAGCYTKSTATTGTPGSNTGMTKKMPPPTHEGMAVGPHNECVEFSPTGECTRWEPTEECVQFDPTGECTKWEPQGE